MGLLVSCASNSGVFRVAENTYQVSTRATWELGGRVGAMRMAMEEATKVLFTARRQKAQGDQGNR